MELVRHGRVVWLRFSSGEEREQKCFDDAAAEVVLRDLIDQHTRDGWTESAETKKRREKFEAARRAAAERLEQAKALSQAADPRAAICERFPDRFELIRSEIVAIDEPTESGFRVRLANGGAIVCGTANDSLWLYPDAESLERNDHAVFFGADAEPPEGDSELDGTRFEGIEVAWFLEETHQRHWFTTRAEPNVAHAWEFDGGLAETSRTPSEVLATALKEAISRG